MGNVTLFCVFCLSSLRNEVKKLIFCTIFHKFDSFFFYLILTLPKCTPFAVFFKKITVVSDKKNNLYWQPILKKILNRSKILV